MNKIWEKTEEKLPTPGVPVLLCHDGKDFLIAKLVNNHWVYGNDTCLLRIYEYWSYIDMPPLTKTPDTFQSVHSIGRVRLGIIAYKGEKSIRLVLDQREFGTMLPNQAYGLANDLSKAAGFLEKT